MSTNTNLGRVGFVLKGEYNSAYTYQALDVVTKSGCLYAAMSDVGLNDAPGESNKWMKLLDDTGKLSANFGTSNSGKVLAVGSDGNVTLIAAPNTSAVFS